LERNAEFIRGLGLADFNISKPQLRISDEDAKQAKLIIEELSLSDNYYILFIGATDTKRKWQPEKFAYIGKKLYETTGMTGIICGSNEEATDAEKIINGALHIPITSLTGRTTLNILAAIIQKSKIIISNETVAVHMAAALSVPCICILGGGHFGRFLPYPACLGTKIQLPAAVYKEMNCFGCNWQCIHSKNNESSYPCISNVSPERVWESIDGLLHGNI
jgi:ADP-heptose:LPS heptosyltransferase